MHAKSLQSCPTQQCYKMAASQSPSMGFSRQEYLNRLSCPLPGDLSNPGIKPSSPVAHALKVDSLLLSHQGSPYFIMYNI